jgi:hypothetical protein
MPRLPASAAPADYLGVNSRHCCARCGGDVIRIPRRPIDRFWSLFVPVYRFRCYQHSCQWIGNLRVDSEASSGTARWAGMK